MESKRTDDGKRTVLALRGRFDTASVPYFNDIVDDPVSEGNDLVLDMNDLDYISSAGIESILNLHRSIGDRLSFVNVKGIVKEELEIVRTILEG